MGGRVGVLLRHFLTPSRNPYDPPTLIHYLELESMPTS
jgi:hypothetical protein